MPDFSVKNALADGRLKTVPDPYVTDSNTIHVVWPSSLKVTPKVRVFVDFVHAHFGKYLVTQADGPKRQKDSATRLNSNFTGTVLEVKGCDELDAAICFADEPS